MCEDHRHLEGTAVAERTPKKAVTVSEEDRIRAAEDHIAGMIAQFGFEAVQKALERKTPKKK